MSIKNIEYIDLKKEHFGEQELLFYANEKIYSSSKIFDRIRFIKIHESNFNEYVVEKSSIGRGKPVVKRKKNIFEEFYDNFI